MVAARHAVQRTGNTPNSVATITKVSSSSVLPDDVDDGDSINRVAGSRLPDRVRCSVCSGCPGLVVEDFLVMVPARVPYMDVPCASIGSHEVARQEATQADFVFSITGTLLLQTGERLWPTAISENPVGLLLERTKAKPIPFREYSRSAARTLSSSVRRWERFSNNPRASPSVVTLPGPALASTSSPEKRGWRKPSVSGGIQIEGDVRRECVRLATLRLEFISD